MTSKRILGFALASVAAGFLTIAAPTFAGCGADHKATGNDGSKPTTSCQVDSLSENKSR